jgi:uncharacterized protein YndB with AHSA1/START domain
MAKSTVEKANGISAAAVQARTGKTWAEWTALLDAAGARRMTHQEIVAHLSEEHGIGPWWQQMVTVGYEQIRGLRVKHQTAAGFQISRSKTIQAPANALFAAWKDNRQRARWLADSDVAIRTAIPDKSLRITWVDGKSSLEVMLYPKGDDKTQVVVNHVKLANQREADRMKAYWAEQLERLRALVELE